MYSLNYGLQIAKGEYIARMDADDYSYPQRLDIQYKYVQQNPSVVLFSNFFNVIDENNNFIATRRLPTEDKHIRQAIKRWNPFCHPSSVFKREIAVKVGGYPNKIYQEDWELWKKMIDFGQVSNIPEILLNYRISSGSESELKTLTNKELRKKDYSYQRRIGIYYLEFALDKKNARIKLVNSLKYKLTISGLYNYFLTFLPSFIIKGLKNLFKGKYYINLEL